jgi:hypothetical protein
MSCDGFSAGETVTIRWGGNQLVSTVADADGSLSTSVEIPGGFAGANNPGRVYTLDAKSQHSGRHASASFIVEEPPTNPPTTPPISE